MIRIEKSGSIPAVLVSRGAELRLQHEADYSASPSLFQKTIKDGGKEFGFETATYHHDSVAHALGDGQHWKCCYCERKLVAPKQVEHWRPKTARTHQKDGGTIRPGYFWLAYDWENLFMSCYSCNQQKGIQFPLAAGTQHAKDHTHAIEQLPSIEFVHPTLEDPSDHITFEEEIVKPKDGSLKGKNTIRVCGLDGESEELRKERLRDIRRAIALVELADSAEITESTQAQLLDPLQLYAIEEVSDLIAEARELVRTAAFPSSPFAGMVRANFPWLATSD